MSVRMITSKFCYPRAILVFAALISLCVSNNVGPSFLPLPLVADGVAEKPHEKLHDKASRVPSPAESDSFRVPMMGQTQKRAATEPQPPPIATTLKAGFVLPTEARVAAEHRFPVPLITSASVLAPPGRAPPRLD